jgi:DNA-binding PadR family transcriptional regulator
MQIAELIILGLLKEGKKHGYEIKQIIDERMALIAEITSGTVYYTLAKLQREGCVKGKKVKSGNRPEKNIYELTKIGEEKFKELLKEVLFIDERPYYSFDLALYFMKYANRKDVISAIEYKMKRIKDYYKFIEELEKKYPKNLWPYYWKKIKERAILNLKTTEKWYRKFYKEIKKREKEG